MSETAQHGSVRFANGSGEVHVAQLILVDTDIFIWIAIHPQNAEKVVAALKAFGSDLPELSAARFLKEGQIIRMGVPPLRIESATSISGVRFEACYAARVIDILDEVDVNFISLSHLKANKKAAGRYTDLHEQESCPNLTWTDLEGEVLGRKAKL